jgi:hypothetical protein
MPASTIPAATGPSMDAPTDMPAEAPRPQVHTLVINSDVPGIPVLVSIDKKNPLSGNTPLTVFAPTGASVRITSEHPRYRQVIREVIVTLDLEIKLEASPEAAGGTPDGPGSPAPGMKVTAPGMTPVAPGMPAEPPMIGEDDTLRPMF